MDECQQQLAGLSDTGDTRSIRCLSTSAKDGCGGPKNVIDSLLSHWKMMDMQPLQVRNGYAQGREIDQGEGALLESTLGASCPSRASI